MLGRIFRSFVFLCFVFVFSGCSLKNIENVSEVNVNEEPILEESDFVEIKENYKLPVLGFHHVGEAPAHLSESAKQWYIKTDIFLRMLDFVISEGYEAITADDLDEYLDSGRMPKKSIMLTFDDGAIDFYTTVFPIIKERKIPVTLFIMTGVGGDNFVNKEQVIEMHDSGFVDIQSHTKYHAYLTRINGEERREELAGSKSYIEELLDKESVAIAYPFGLFDDSVVEEVQEVGYKLGFTIVSGNEQVRDDRYRLNRKLVTENTNLADVLTK